MTDTTDMRRDFEAFMHAAGKGRANAEMFEVDANGDYVLPTIYATFYGWQAATAIERERCAVVCDANQVAHNVNQGHFLVNWPTGSYGVHESMTYAAAIRQGGDT